MKALYALFLSTVFLPLTFNCTSDVKQNMRKKIGNLTVEAHFDNDTTIDGIAKFYDQSNRLVSTVSYKHGLKDGVSVNYYKNGGIKDSMIFHENKRYGSAFHYDSMGHLSAEDYQYYGIKVGPALFYNEGKIQKYYFTDFNKNDLLVVEYDSTGRITDFSGLSMQATVTRVKENDQPKLELFLYLPAPPLLHTRYEFGLTDKTKKLIPLASLPKNDFCYDTLIPYPKDGMYYYVCARLKSSDSSVNKLFIEDLPDW